MTELLVKMTILSKTPNGEPAGGIPEITMEDVAGACAGMNRHAYLYALAKFCLDSDVMPELARLHRQMAVCKAALEGWRCKPETVLEVADMSLHEALTPRVCRRCKGAGLQHNQRPCPSCGGKARLGLDGGRGAESLGVSRQDWSRIWRRRVEGVVGDLLLLEDTIARHIKRRVYRG